MKFFASALLIAGINAAPAGYRAQTPRYAYVPQVRYRQVPHTVYETVYDTKYRDVERTEYRDVEESYTVDVPVVHRLLHEHSSDGDVYD